MGRQVFQRALGEAYRKKNKKNNGLNAGYVRGT